VIPVSKREFSLSIRDVDQNIGKDLLPLKKSEEDGDGGSVNVGFGGDNSNNKSRIRLSGIKLTDEDVGWIGSVGKNGLAGSDGVSEVQVVEPQWVNDEPREHIGSMHTSNNYMVCSSMAIKSFLHTMRNIRSLNGLGDFVRRNSTSAKEQLALIGNTIGETGEIQMSSSSVSPQMYN
nr:probable pre-mRNA-splicing factor ATP-dependent RNA helicase DEAH5 [Tanacetum cinerariifolium]